MIGSRRLPEELHNGTHENEQGERLFESLPPNDGPGNLWCQFHNEIDHIIFNRKYCLTDVSVVPKFYKTTRSTTSSSTASIA
ncbi:unnamed protein product [Heligmosomoides polygyrus]|uniref:Uncharacterized protein n=1 Tax=Heligmosomoides polygyrus TaxID=6339 RepID=A0A183F2I0_HELPZ|nr:unnamed protein product [Heligmosomoides polygyrus]